MGELSDQEGARFITIGRNYTHCLSNCHAYNVALLLLYDGKENPSVYSASLVAYRDFVQLGNSREKVTRQEQKIGDD